MVKVRILFVLNSSLFLHALDFVDKQVVEQLNKVSRSHINQTHLGKIMHYKCINLLPI